MGRKIGFTLIELTITIAIIAAIAGVYFVTTNPAGQIASARNSERRSQLEAIMNAIQQNVADQGNEKFSCSSGPVPTSTTRMMSAPGGYNIAPCIIIQNGAYGLYSLPFDPVAAGAHYTSLTDYDTGYSIIMNSSTGQIVLTAPYAELGKAVSVTE